MDHAEDRLLLRSNLSDMARLPPWIEGLACRHGIPKSIEFAINLCLEEAVSNIILHGYGDGMDGSVTVRFTMQQQDMFIFVIEDEARHFDPFHMPPPDPQGTVRVGGRGHSLPQGICRRSRIWSDSNRQSIENGFFCGKFCGVNEVF